MSINRRAFFGWAGVGGAASSLWIAFAKQPLPASADSPVADLEQQSFRNSASSYPFPKNFIWGVATSAYQIEGAVNEGGRKPSVWDSFSAIPERIKDGSTAAVYSQSQLPLVCRVHSPEPSGLKANQKIHAHLHPIGSTRE